VSDDGEGIRHEHLPHVFAPFYSEKVPGTRDWLGWATVYGIVRQNRGFKWALQRTRVVVFNIYPPCVSERNAPEAGDPVEARASGGSETILLAEDEPAVRHPPAEFLFLQGYAVLEAKPGLEALTAAKNHGSPIPLVITDVVPPRMGGGRLAQGIRRLRRKRRLLFVSGYAGPIVLDHKGFDLETNFLQTPSSWKQLSGKDRASK
jgi:CheY-like chemotaxis protein